MTNKTVLISRSKLRKWLKRHRFMPMTYGCKGFRGQWRDFFAHGAVAKKGRRFYRFRNNEHRITGGEACWVVDVSSLIEEFDRWANSTDQAALPLSDWMHEWEARTV